MGLVGGSGKTSPVIKQDQPMKTPSMKTPGLPAQIDGGPNKVATLGSPKLTRPAKITPRSPRI